MRLIPTMALTAVAVTTSACGTIFSSAERQVHVASTPEPAEIYVDNQLRGSTPLAVTVDRRLEAHQLRVTREGYVPATMPVTRSFNPVSLLNIFFLPGFIVDAATGAIFNYTDSMSVDLQPQAPAAQTPVAHTGS